MIPIALPSGKTSQDVINAAKATGPDSCTGSAMSGRSRRSLGGNRSLGVFVAIPAIILAMLFPFGESTLMDIEHRETPQVVIKVEGFQWEWTFLYQNEGIFVSGKTVVRAP